MRKVLRVSTVAALVVGVLALFVGVAQSMIPSADGTYYGCYKIVGGNLRIIDESASCRRDEVGISWNEQGLPGEPGEPGAPGLSYAGYTHMTLEQGNEQAITIPFTPPPSGQAVTIADLQLPEPPDGGGYLVTATFQVRNLGPGDALLVCHVGNQMAYEVFAPVNQLSDPGGPGLWGSDTSLVTLSGLSDYGGLRLACGINSYIGDQEGAEVPVVKVVAYTLSAVLIDQLDNEVAVG